MLDLIYSNGLFTLDQHGAGRSAARVGRYYHYLYVEVWTRSAGTDWDRLAAAGFGGLTAVYLSFLVRCSCVFRSIQRDLCMAPAWEPCFGVRRWWDGVSKQL